MSLKPLSIFRLDPAPSLAIRYLRNSPLRFCPMTPIPGGATSLYRTLSFGPSNTIRRASTIFREDGVMTIPRPGDTPRRGHVHNRRLVLRSPISPVPSVYTTSHLHRTFCASPPPSRIYGLSHHVPTHTALRRLAPIHHHPSTYSRMCDTNAIKFGLSTSTILARLQ